MNDCQVERIHQRTISECSYHFPIAPISSSSASICSANSTIRWSWCSPSWIAVKMKVKSVHLIDLYGQTDPPVRSQYAGGYWGGIFGIVLICEWEFFWVITLEIHLHYGPNLWCYLFFGLSLFWFSSVQLLKIQFRWCIIWFVREHLFVNSFSNNKLWFLHTIQKGLIT